MNVPYEKHSKTYDAHKGQFALTCDCREWFGQQLGLKRASPSGMRRKGKGK
jgi:hypothetical protein